MSYYYSLPHSTAYQAVSAKLANGDCVLIDGGVASEVEKVRTEREGARDERWGLWALHEARQEVLTVHRRYVEAGCDVISTNTWAILDARRPPRQPDTAWQAAATSALRIARRAISDADRTTDCAIAFCINGAIVGEESLGALELLTWTWLQDPPDLVVFETLTRLPGPDVLRAVQMVVAVGLPVWVSLRRVAGGMAMPDGTPLAPSGPDALGDCVEALEQSGVSALLVNCIPIDAVQPVLAELSSLTELPLGCYPNLGHGRLDDWRPGAELSPDLYADEALGWWEAGARLIGGCCGVGPEHVKATADRVRSAPAWSARGV